MELRDIEYFAVVAEHGHLGRAAEALGLTQPALSKSLRRLEKSMQAKLVRRTPKGVELTAEGSALLGHVRPLRLSLHDITREIAELGEGRSGHLRLGSIPGPADYLLGNACSALLKDAPNARITVTVATNPVLVSALRNGELDMIVGNMLDPPAESVFQEHLFDDHIVVHASSRHRLAGRRRLILADLVAERWAVSAADAVPWKWVQRVFEDNRLPPPRLALASGPLQLRLQAIASSDLLGFSPRWSLREFAERLNLREIPVRELVWSRPVCVGIRRDGYVPPAARRFLDILRSAARDLVRQS